jgi:hypothetical protein
VDGLDVTGADVAAGALDVEATGIGMGGWTSTGPSWAPRDDPTHTTDDTAAAVATSTAAATHPRLATLAAFASVRSFGTQSRRARREVECLPGKDADPFEQRVGVRRDCALSRAAVDQRIGEI